MSVKYSTHGFCGAHVLQFDRKEGGVENGSVVLVWVRLF